MKRKLDISPYVSNSNCFESIPGPSTSSGSVTHSKSQSEASFSSSDEDGEDEKEKVLDRDLLLKNIDDDINRILGKGKKVNNLGGDVKKKKEECENNKLLATFKGRDGVEYSLQVFMRNSANCQNRRVRAGRGDPRSPFVQDREGKYHAIIRAGHKLMLLCERRATNPRHFIPRGTYALFRFYVDGEALSEGELNEASIKEPGLNWAKSYIDTHSVSDHQKVEHAHEANAHMGTFEVKVFTKLRESLVTEQFNAVPEDNRVFEKTKRRICCAVPPPEKDEPGCSSSSGNKQVKTFEEPTAGLKESGPPAAVLEVSYDDLLGTRSRHWGQPEFSIDNLRSAGVDEDMLKEAYPTGVPGAVNNIPNMVVDLTEEEDVKTEIKEETE